MARSDLEELAYPDFHLAEIAERVDRVLEEVTPEDRKAFATILVCKDLLYYLQNSVNSVTAGFWQLNPIMMGRAEGHVQGVHELILSPVYHRLIESSRSYEVILQGAALRSYGGAARELRGVLEAIVEAYYIECKLERKTLEERAEAIMEIPNEWRRFSELLRAVDPGARQVIRRLYSDLSEYIHPNYGEFVTRFMGRSPLFPDAHGYDPAVLEEVSSLVTRTTDAVAYVVFAQFPDAYPNLMRKRKVKKFANILDLPLLSGTDA